LAFLLVLSRTVSFIYGFNHSFVRHSFYMSQPAQPFAFNVSYYIFMSNCILQLLICFDSSLSIFRLSIIEIFSSIRFFLGRGCWPCAQPPTWRARVSLFVWLLPFDLSGLGDSTSSYATAGIALRVAEARKIPHHNMVETPSGEDEFRYMYFITDMRKKFSLCSNCDTTS
jgi:hypothetical protein